VYLRITFSYLPMPYDSMFKFLALPDQIIKIAVPAAVSVLWERLVAATDLIELWERLVAAIFSMPGIPIAATSRSHRLTEKLDHRV
jgi:hypothetical protein